MTDLQPERNGAPPRISQNPRPALLLVEDSEDDAFFFHRTLRKSAAPCELEHVADGGAAVEFLLHRFSRQAKLPDLVFLDLKMPVMSGFDVLEWIQQQPFASLLKVIVLSGSNQQGDRVRAEKLGAAGYLVKPVAPQDLIAALQRFQGIPSLQRTDVAASPPPASTSPSPLISSHPHTPIEPCP